MIQLKIFTLMDTVKKQKVLDKYIYLLYKLNDEEIKIVETVMQE